MSSAKRVINYPMVFKKSPLSGFGNGTPGSGISVVEKGDGEMHTTELTFKDVAIALADNAGVVAYGGKSIYTFPAGAIAILHAVANLAITKSSAGVNADWDGDFGIGSVTANNTSALSTTEQNIIPTTATPQAVSGATTAKGQATAAVYLDGTTTAIQAFLNFLVDDADHDVTTTPCNLILNGTVKIKWTNGGDY